MLRDELRHGDGEEQEEEEEEDRGLQRRQLLRAAADRPAGGQHLRPSRPCPHLHLAGAQRGSINRHNKTFLFQRARAKEQKEKSHTNQREKNERER